LVWNLLEDIPSSDYNIVFETESEMTSKGALISSREAMRLFLLNTLKGESQDEKGGMYNQAVQVG
jgi:hypothetical protein